MSSKEDIEAGEKNPLLSHLDKQEKSELEELEDVGADESAFAKNVQLAVRGAFMMMLMASIIWVAEIRKPFPNEVQNRMALVACLFAFTVNPILGNAIANGFCGILGTFWACFHMWVMNGIYPGGMKEGMSPTSAAAIFGWVNFLLFLWVILFCKCGIGMKMFALANDIGFMLAFIDPASTLVFSENFSFNYRGTAVNVMLATSIACILAPLMNLLPYPMTSAFTDMKKKSMKASKDTAKLFHGIVDYYCRDEPSVVIESLIKHSNDLRKELDAMGGSIAGAWWEGFDIGTRGTIRALMESHLGLLNEVYDRLRAIIIAVSTEDFGASHNKIMIGIGGSTKLVTQCTTKLLIAVTEAAGDGDISDGEKDELKKLIAGTKGAVQELAIEFDKARRAFATVSHDTMGESFFVVTLSAYARMVCEYAEMLTSSPPQGAGFSGAVKGGISSTWTGLTEAHNMNFTIKHFVAIVICWLYSVYVDGFAGGCVITAVFLISPNVCPDIQAFLNVMNAVILGVIIGSLVFSMSCGSGYGYILLPLCSFVVWTLSYYGWFSGSPLALPALLVVALTPFKWIANCPTGDISAGARGLWAGMVANCLAIMFVASCQYFLAINRPSALAIESMDEAFTNMESAFKAFFKAQDAAEPIGPVAGNLGSGTGFNNGAKIEPRFWRASWKGAFYDEVVALGQQLRLDILMTSKAMAGSDGQPDSIFAKFDKLPAFHEVEKDLITTLEDAHGLVIDLISNESGTFSGLSKLKTTTGIDELDALPGLVGSLGNQLKFPTKVGETIEDDEVAQISSVFLLLDFTIKHIAAVLKVSIRCS